MKAKPLPSQESLKDALRYDPKSGLLSHRDGKPAFTSRASSGYMVGRLGGRLYLAHRIIWKMVFGDEPPQIDHRNHIKDDNRIKNLRRSSDAQNRINMPLRADNKSGRCGVRFCAIRQKWVAQIRREGITYPLGRFATKEAATKVRADAEARFGFLENHGKSWHDQNKDLASQF